MKYINFVINTTTNQTAGHFPYELIFGRTPIIPSTVNTSPNLSYQELIRKWKKKHEEIIFKPRERIQVEMEKTKRRLDEHITRKHLIDEARDLVKTLSNTKQNKLEPAWKCPFGVIDYIDNSNLRIRNKDKIIRIHINQYMPYLFSRNQPSIKSLDSETCKATLFKRSVNNKSKKSPFFSQRNVYTHNKRLHRYLFKGIRPRCSLRK